MKRALAMLLVTCMVMGTMAGCVQAPAAPASSAAPAASSAAPAESSAPASSDSTAAPIEVTDYTPDLSENVTLDMSVFYNNSVYMKYTVDGGNGKPQSEYNAADGKTYREGDWKPTWAELQKRLNFTINDVVPTDAKNVAAAYTTLEAQGFEGVDIMVAPAAKVSDAGVTNGTFLNLNKYLDKMPNFAKFLNENTIVKTSITSGDGGIYYAPYFDGYNDIERMFMVRIDWVQKLLDDDAATYDTARTVDTYYQPYMPETLDTKVTSVKADGSATQEITVKYDKNIISIQNALDVKNGETLTKALKDYIDSTYGNQFAKRSDLFCGQDASYNADELVALMRCVLANPQLLSGQSEMDVVPFFPRKYQAGRVQQLFSIAEMWGVRGLESRNGYFYINENGELCDARYDMAMMDALERMNAMYKEGLILQDFDKDESTKGLDGSEHRARLLQANLGFCTYDYNQTTTVYNTLDEKIDGFNFGVILPPVADWDNNGSYYRNTASWRSVKTDCWTILAKVADNEAKLNRALALFDYLYSEEGNRLMSFGPEAWIDGTIMYNGKEVPKLNEKTLTELKELANGNYTNYYRMWLGAAFPIGYVKEQGMEFQTVHEKGKPGLEYILNACNLGAMRHLVVSESDAKSKADTMVPTTFALSKMEVTMINDNCADLNNAFKNGNNDTDRIFFTDYVIYGFGGTDANGNKLLDKQGVIDYLYKDLKGETHLACHQSAYDRMLEMSK